MNNIGTGIFWYWNATPSPSGIRRQLGAIADAGFECVYLHPLPDNFHKHNFFSGMKCAYLGEKYFDLVRVSLEECKKRGLFLMLYDEGGWPSGSVLDTLVKKYPECRGRYLVRDRRGKVRTVRTDFPDLLAADSTRHFIEMTHDLYFRHFGPEFGKTIRGIFTDEPFFRCVPDEDMVYYSPGMDGLIREMFDCGFTRDILPFLWKGTENRPGAAAARRKYMAAASRLFAENYFSILGRWCEEHNIGLEGHVDHDDSFFRNGDCGSMPEQFSSVHVPGVDAIWRQIYPGLSVGRYARFASSAAMANGRKQALCECFNVYGYGITGPVISWVANVLFIQGINRVIPMPFLYSDRGLHKICCSTDFSPRIPLWESFKELNRRWRIISRFDLGAVESPVWVLARCELSTPDDLWAKDPRRAKAEKRMADLLAKLDSHGIFWRFTDLTELKKTTAFPKVLLFFGILDDWEKEIIDSVEKRGTKILRGWDNSVAELACVRLSGKKTTGCLVRPCVRPEGEALMIFNPNPQSETFRFSSRESWGELPLDETVFRLFPLSKRGAVYSVEVPPGDLRILLKGGCVPHSPSLQKKTLRPDWHLAKVEQLNFSADRPTAIRKIKGDPEFLADGFWKQPDFSGILTLSAELECDRPVAGFLCFDKICHAGSLRVNGAEPAVRVCAPWAFPVELKKGKNRLELRILSSAGNEWRRCLARELEPRKWFNNYLKRLRTYTIDDAETGVSPDAVLLF